MAAGVQALQKNIFNRLLSDIVMSELVGIAMALSVSRDWYGMPIILITGYIVGPQRAHNLEALVYSVVPKPFDLQKICSVVEETLAASPQSG